MKRSFFARGIIALLIVLIGVMQWTSAQITITVDVFTDTGAASSCPASPCTLRDALSVAVSGDTITFSGAGTISINSVGGLGELPTLASGGVTIDAGGNPVILDGSTSPDTLDYGLLITSDENTILGLDIRGFDGAGIEIQDGSGNQIGGDGAGEGNILHLNGGDGIVLDGAGTTTSPNVIAGNLIGTDPLGNSVEANGGVGIRVLNDSEANVIGGSSATSGNVISGNDDGGIVIDSSDDTVIEGNRIGLDASTGLVGLGNGTLAGDAGILVSGGSTGTMITDNAISASAGDGVFITDGPDTEIRDNRIGVDDAFGILGLGNGRSGVYVSGSTNVTITNNTAADNAADGILLETGADDATISGNLVGLGDNGEVLLGNGGIGIALFDSASSVVSGNRVADNGGPGIEINGTGSTDNSISGNQIGLTLSSGSAGNGDDGIRIDGASENSITNNTSANNVSDGIGTVGGTGNTFSANVLFDNAELGIDLASDDLTLNDLNDADPGSNSLQNFPELLSASFDGVATTTVAGVLNTELNQDYVIEFFTNSACDPLGYGEAETVLGVTTAVTTDSTGNAVFLVDLTGAAPGEFITAIATNSTTGSSSELAACVLVETVTVPPVADFSAAPASGPDPLTVTFTDLSTGVISNYLWIFGDGNFSTAQNPVNTYTAPGTYTVQLIVTGPDGIDEATDTIIVIGPTNTPRPAEPPPAVEADTQTPVPSATATTSIPTATWTGTATLTPSRTLTSTVSATPTATQTRTPSRTPTATVTPSRTATLRATASRTPTQSPTASATLPPSRTVTQTATLTSTLPPTSTATITATLIPELTVVKVTDESGFDILLQNAGSGDIDRLQVQESLRQGVRYISSRPGLPVCVEDEGVVFCVLGSLAAGEQTVLDFTVLSDGTDPASGRTVVTADGTTLTLIDQPYLFKIGEPPVAAAGATVIYTLRVINPTDEIAQQVRVQDTMPEAIEILDATASSGTVQVDGQSVAFSQSQLGPGERATITLTTRVRDDDTYNEIVNRACLTSSANRSPSCAQMTFLRAGEIPPTGEPPLLRLLAILAGVSGVLYFGRRLLIRRRRQL